MFIVPISPINSIEELNAVSKPQPAEQKNEPQLPFSSVLQQAVDNVKETHAQEVADAYNLSIGTIDDPAQLMINQEKAMMAVEMLQSIRNNVLDSYKEIMNMGI